MLHDGWVDWGDDDTNKTTVSLWSRCMEDEFNFRKCVELRNSPEDGDLADAGLVALILLISAVAAGVVGVYVAAAFAFGKPMGLCCFSRARNAGISFFLTFFVALTTAGAWVAYSSIYYSTDRYRNAPTNQTAGASFYLVVVASVLSGVGALGALFNWWVDARRYEDTVYKKPVIASVLITIALVLVALALGTRGWIRSPQPDSFKLGEIEGRATVGLFQFCIESGSIFTCTYLRNDDADDAPVKNVTDIPLSTLNEGGTTAATMLVLGLAFGAPAAFLSMVHGLRKDIGCLCLAKERNGMVVFVLNILLAAIVTIAWISYSSVVYSSQEYKDSNRLKAGFSLGFAIAASIVSAFALLFSCLSRHQSPDWYGSYYDGDDTTGDDTTDDETTATTYDSEEQETYSYYESSDM